MMIYHIIVSHSAAFILLIHSWKYCYVTEYTAMAKRRRPEDVAKSYIRCKSDPPWITEIYINPI